MHDRKLITQFSQLVHEAFFTKKEAAGIVKGNQEATAETIENNVRKTIIDGMPGNPIYFELMSKLLAEIIKQRRNKALSYREYLHKIIELAKNQPKY